MKNILLLGLVAISLTGCATALTNEGARIIQLDQVQQNVVKDCKALGQTSGTSTYGGLFMQEAGKNYAKNQAMNNAVNMGATHVVWTVATGGFFGGNASGIAYKCTKLTAK